jgi:membrane fusion protein
MTPLFRPEATEGHRRSGLGEVRLVRPLPLGLMTLAVALAAMAVGTWLWQGHYTRKAHLAGVLVPDRGLVRLAARDAARVAERRVREGQAVKAGDVLFVLSLDRATGSGDAQVRVQRGLAERQGSLQDSLAGQQRLLAEQQGTLRSRRAELAREREQLTAEQSLQQQRLELARQSLARLESLKGESFVSDAQVQARREEVLALQAQLKALDRQQVTLARELAAVEGALREAPLQAQARSDALRREAAALAQDAAESDARREFIVTAPQDGTVTALLAEVGQSVPEDGVLATLLPAGTRLQAQLFAPSGAIGFVREQQPVQLRVAAFPYQKFGHQSGRVLQVARTPLAPADLAVLALPPAAAGSARAGEPLYRITVELQQDHVMAYGRPEPLAAGMQLEADVMLDRRRLVEWLFEPVLGVAGRI